MAKGQRYIIVDEYTEGLLQQIVSQGKASDLPKAVSMAAASYLGVPHKSKQERQMEQELAHIQQLAKMAGKEE